MSARSRRPASPNKLAILDRRQSAAFSQVGGLDESHLFGTIIPTPLSRGMEKSAEPVREGIRICVELIEELATIPGVAGVHIMAPGNDAAIPEVIARVKAACKRRR